MLICVPYTQPSVPRVGFGVRGCAGAFERVYTPPRLYRLLCSKKSPTMQRLARPPRLAGGWNLLYHNLAAHSHTCGAQL